jgi:transitional endoplasmic reticulum ATPase
MTHAGYELRPGAETFEHAGCRVALVDPAGILAEARVRRVDLLHGGVFPPPVRQVRFLVANRTDGDSRAGVLEAEIRTGPDPGYADRPSTAVLGNDPLGLLLARRVAAGDPWAVKIVDGVGVATAKAQQWLGLDRPATPAPGDETVEPAVREVETAGLRATVTHEDIPSGPDEVAESRGRIVRVRAEVPGDALSAAHLRAMFCLVLDVVGKLAGEDRDGAARPGRRYVLSRYPAGDPADSDAGDDVRLDQVGGLPDVVAQFRQIAVSFRHPDVMARWGARRPQGILMYGPPGTGKTMLARALANEIGATFREIRTPEILDKWLGASERNIKRIFGDARRYRTPTVLLFDEFDSIIGYAAGGSDAASQAVNAVAGIFKQEMNNLIEHNPNVIVVATTNFPHRVDDSLIRSGRFDVKLAIPLPDETGRADIITKMIRGLIMRYEVSGFRMFADDVDVLEMARATHGMTGADIKEVLRRVQLTKAMQEARTGVAAPPITQADLSRSADELRNPRSR